MYVKTILQAFQPEYVMVEYFDPLEGEVVTKEFYTGDKTAPVHIWSGSNQLYTNAGRILQNFTPVKGVFPPEAYGAIFLFIAIAAIPAVLSSFFVPETRPEK